MMDLKKSSPKATNLSEKIQNKKQAEDN